MTGWLPVAEEKPAPAACAFGVEISTDRQRCAVVRAHRPDDRITVDMVWYEPPAEAVAFINGCYEADDPVAIALDPRSQTETLLRKLADAGVPVTRLGAEDVAVANGEFMDLLARRELRHLGQPEMTAAVRAAQQRPLAGAQAWERKVTVDQSPLNACTFAVWALQRYEELAQPGVWT